MVSTLKSYSTSFLPLISVIVPQAGYTINTISMTVVYTTVRFLRNFLARMAKRNARSGRKVIGLGPSRLAAHPTFDRLEAKRHTSYDSLPHMIVVRYWPLLPIRMRRT
ncbi:hypothetical protein EVAR_7136_1 [Eumeta japonica]|uniref:Uncharacterized protein n=1 Tax=Eumeta variegata TaxID=151549 RepID=A0A4C1U6C2_EUMVA|nr:hypothetical protein EVAR_7136_1 [Eumeta japonica]